MDDPDLGNGQAAPWSTSPLAPSSRVRTVRAGARTALFCGRAQQLSELNATAADIWAWLREGLSCAAIAARLEGSGASPSEAARYVQSAVSEWLRLGYAAPVEVSAALSGAPSSRRRLRIAGAPFELRFFQDAPVDRFDLLFAQLADESADPAAAVSIVGRFGEEFVFLDDAPVGMTPPRRTVPAVKALLTEEYCKVTTEGFLAHGAMVSKGGKRVFIGGEPGAGKTTLTLALTGSGFAYGGDDIVHVTADGAAQGAPFPAAAKSGAWALLSPYVPEIDALAIHERADSQITRYVAPRRLDRDGPRPIDVMLLLARRPGAAARLEPVDAMDALCALIESGYSRQGALEAQTIVALARRLSSATRLRLQYDDLAGAIALVETLVRE